MDTITIRNDAAFRAEIPLENLTQIELTGWKRLCKLLRLYTRKNEETIRELNTWFPEALSLEKECRDMALRSYELEYIDPETVSRKLRKTVREDNRRLKELVSCTQKSLDRLLRFHAAYAEAVNAI